MVGLPEGMRPEKRKNQAIEAVVDRMILKPLPPNVNETLSTSINAVPHNSQLTAHSPQLKYDTRRLETSVLKALQMANGLVLIAIHGMDETLYSSSMACPDCGINVPRLEPH